MAPAPPPVHARRGRPSTRVEGNARLTGGLAAVLLVLLAAEGVTILRIGPLLTWHVVIGLILVPVVLAKMASTMWRFARYYLGDPDFRAKGPPRVVLRLLGPLVVVLTVVLFASGVALLVGPLSWRHGLLLLHKLSFVLWFAVMAVHVLGHLAETGRLAPADWLGSARRRVSGAGARRALIVSTLIVGLLLALSLRSHVATYRHGVRPVTRTSAGSAPLRW